MRIHIDEKLCSGHGRCYTLEPTVFQADDDGYPLQRGHDVEVAAADEASARRGVANCPEGAISVIGS